MSLHTVRYLDLSGNDASVLMYKLKCGCLVCKLDDHKCPIIDLTMDDADVKTPRVMISPTVEPFVPVPLVNALVHDALVQSVPVNIAVAVPAVPELSPDFVRCLEGPSQRQVNVIVDMGREAALFSNQEHCKHVNGVSCKCGTCGSALCVECASVCGKCGVPRCDIRAFCKMNHLC